VFPVRLTFGLVCFQTPLGSAVYDEIDLLFPVAPFPVPRAGGKRFAAPYFVCLHPPSRVGFLLTVMVGSEPSNTCSAPESPISPRREFLETLSSLRCQKFTNSGAPPLQAVDSLIRGIFRTRAGHESLVVGGAAQKPFFRNSSFPEHHPPHPTLPEPSEKSKSQG
jgi:hypothetical protein